MLRKAYLEITNVCNLDCTFCHGTKRSPCFMPTQKFLLAAQRIRPHTDYLYFHLMGEPLLHPDFPQLLDIATSLDFKTVITTNGTLLDKTKTTLLASPSLHKVSISVHCYDANDMTVSLEDYMNTVLDFAKSMSDKDKICVLRLWNLGSDDTPDAFNRRVLSIVENSFPKPWKQVYSGFKLCDGVFIEWGNRFDWPDMDASEVGANHSCYGLRDQIGVLCDGTVVPCCLDADGVINLGNIFETDLESILCGERACALKKSFENKNVCEELCKKCGFASKFR